MNRLMLTTLIAISISYVRLRNAWALRALALAALFLCFAAAGQPIHAQTRDPGLAAAFEAILTTRTPQPDDAIWHVTDARQHGAYAIASAYRSAPARHLPAGGQIVLAHRTGDRWQVYLPGDAGYAALLAQIPETLLGPGDRAWIAAIIPVARPAAMAAVAGYWLPWPAGQSAHVTQNYSEHGTGQIDFWLLGDDVVAAKGGEIVYINDSHTARGCSIDFARYNNVVVIRHAAQEYTIYAHVATGSVPEWIRSAYAEQGVVPVTQGTRIARQGNVGFTCGGDGIHLHLSTTANYGAWTAPDSQDEDGDGNRDELVETAWGSPHQEVDFDEAAYAALTTWPFETLLISQNRDVACTNAVQNGVALFAVAGCHGETLVLPAATGVTNLPERGWNDRAQAIAVAAGWSARVYEHIDGLGASRCISATLASLAGEGFDSSATTLAREISSLAVYRGSTCAPPPVTVETEAVPAALTLADGATQIVTVTMRTTATLGVQFTARTLSLESSPGTALAGFAAQSTFTDIALGANNTLTWIDELLMPADAISEAWQQGFTTLSVTLRYIGVDALSRPVTAAATWPLDLAACGMAGEWNDDGTHATSLALNSVVTGRLCPAGDRDFYVFDGIAGQAIWAAVESAQNTLDPNLSLYALNTITPLATVDDVAGSLDALLAYTLPVSGLYALAVQPSTPWSSDPTATYTLTASTAPLALPGCTAAPDNDGEPDDAPAQARTARVDGSRLAGTRHTTGDRDWYAFSAATGETYTIEMSGKAATQATIFAADALTPLATAALTPTVASSDSITWTAPTGGAYYVEVSGNDAGCTAVYSLRITAQDATPPGVTLTTSGNGYTNQPAVTLTIAATDTGSGVDALRLAGTAAFAGVAWSTVPTQTLWTLPDGDGRKTIYAQVRDQRGNRSQVVTATIMLDTTAPPLALEYDRMVLGLPTLRLPLVTAPDIFEVRWRITGDAWSEWRPVDSAIPIVLPGQFGVYAVEIQARDLAGNLSTIRNLVVSIVPPVLYLPLVSSP